MQRNIYPYFTVFGNSPTGHIAKRIFYYDNNIISKSVEKINTANGLNKNLIHHGSAICCTRAKKAESRLYICRAGGSRCLHHRHLYGTAQLHTEHLQCSQTQICNNFPSVDAGGVSLGLARMGLKKTTFLTKRWMTSRVWTRNLSSLWLMRFSVGCASVWRKFTLFLPNRCFLGTIDNRRGDRPHGNSMPALRQPRDGPGPLVGVRLLRRLRQNFLAPALRKGETSAGGNSFCSGHHHGDRSLR